jgi:hypothetical protein
MARFRASGSVGRAAVLIGLSARPGSWLRRSTEGTSVAGASAAGLSCQTREPGEGQILASHLSRSVGAFAFIGGVIRPLEGATQAPEPPPAPDGENRPRIGRSLVLAKALTHLPV